MKATFRRATINDTTQLTELTHRSKAYWGYDEDFMRNCQEELTVRESHIINDISYVLETDGQIVGFYTLSVMKPNDTIELEYMFIEPNHIGLGYGKKLLHHAIDQCKVMNCQRLMIQSDPNAKQFYIRHGGVQISEEPSNSIADRMLPYIMIKII